MDNNTLIWYKLDSAAKLFAAISDEYNTNVFRISCQLAVKINPELLQSALDIALENFPPLKTRLKKGLFWYFLEYNPRKLLVEKETTYPCTYIHYRRKPEYLIRVSYFENRINLEMFHALTDGNGAFALLKNLIFQYLKLVFPEHMEDMLPPVDSEIAPLSQEENSFEKYYDKSDKNSYFQTKAYRVTGPKLLHPQVHAIRGIFNTKQLLALAKANKATLTEYLSAAIIYSIYKENMPSTKRNKPIKINIPVNLRNHFESNSLRNFFACIGCGYTFSNDASFDEVLHSVSSQIKEQLNKKILSSIINYNVSTEKNVFARFTPLPLKNFVLNRAYHSADGVFSSALSNLGQVVLPDEMKPYVRHFEVYLPPTKCQPIKFALCSYEDKLCITYTSSIQTQIPQYFFSFFTKQGIDIVVSGNEVDHK